MYPLLNSQPAETLRYLLVDMILLGAVQQVIDLLEPVQCHRHHSGSVVSAPPNNAVEKKSNHATDKTFWALHNPLFDNTQ